MGVPFLIIDGYNLLHAAGLARLRYAQGDLDRARQRLLGMLSEKLSPPEQMRCTIVFDALNAPLGMTSTQRHHEMRVLFAEAGQDADSLIEDLVAKHPAARQLVVVSSDHRLHKAARRRNGQPIDSEVFWEHLQSRPNAWAAYPGTPPAPAKPTPGPTRMARETSEWLAEFGDVSVEDLAAEVRAEDQSQPGGSPWERHLDDLERTMNNPAQLEQFLRDDQREPPRPKP